MSKQIYANVSGVPLSIAVFLATDNYDYDPDTISATALMKPVRQIILGNRIPPNTGGMADLKQLMASRVGTAIHDAIERSWKNNYESALGNIGIPEKVIKLVKINPTEEMLIENPDIIPVYLEQRSSKTVGKYKISGKFDFVGEGRVEDFKTTSVYKWTSNTSDASYQLQGSIYRWLNPKIITKDTMAIQFIFTDWSAAQARSNPSYPQSRFEQRVLDLYPIQETDRWVRNKLALIDSLEHVEESALPLCTDEELWRSEAVFKYYSNPDKTTGRSTKNFDSLNEATVFRHSKGVGVVIEKPGQVTACKYCNAFAYCSQKDTLIAAGDLIL